MHVSHADVTLWVYARWFLVSVKIDRRDVTAVLVTAGNQMVAFDKTQLLTKNV